MQFDLTILVVGILYFIRILWFLVVLRVIFSWVAPHSRHPAVVFVVNTSEAFIAPIRNVIPRGRGGMAMIDWSPLVALILLDVLRYVVVRVFA